jgi:L-2-hydroxycarboxylate dehydrogenase (NAD+)
MTTTPAGDFEAKIDQVQEIGEALFGKLGVPEVDAQQTVETLIEADLRGVESHGIAHLVDFYVRRIQRGTIKPTPNIRTVAETPSTAVIDGDQGLGFVVSHRAMDLAVEKANKVGSGFVSVRNSTHYGAGFHYALKAARQGMVGLSVTTGGNIVIPPGAKHRTYGANVISVAAPTDRDFFFVLDGSTSAVAGGKLEIARRRGTGIPEGWALDENGEPTTDPHSFIRGGGLLPLGGSPSHGAYKGFGMALFADIISGVLAGSGASLTLSSGQASHTFAAFRIEAFLSEAEYKQHMAAMIDGLKAAERQPGIDEILIPGELEARLEADRAGRGIIPLHPTLVQGINDACEEFGLELRLT